MISILDCNLGNIGTLVSKISLLTDNFQVTQKYQDLEKSEKIIFPGVGNSKYAIEFLNKNPELKRIKFLINEKKIPILGICVGAQLMGSFCEEANQKGLSILQFDTLRIPQKKFYNLPHVGWNYLNFKKETFLYDKVDRKKRFYFTHSYFMKTNDSDIIEATSYYGIDIPSVISKNNIFCIQFHPEKSREQGIQVLKNFIEYEF